MIGSMQFFIVLVIIWWVKEHFNPNAIRINDQRTIERLQEAILFDGESIYVPDGNGTYTRI